MRAPLSSIPEALTVPEVMHALRLSRSKVYDLIRSRQLPSFTVGRARRIPVDAVREYMRNQMKEAA
ncbi:MULTISPECIES: helix-turn-helix domain-containing protein [unclassified Streptomyces]|uniref:helix-turn-helix domain-containing protein n=1 Tax=unclassified Streptomyces TaxID=2593676 RepID=UPI002E3480CC|nr:helix-turn-helix domain-containing protein [Streptomyces sp. NBC_01693]